MLFFDVGRSLLFLAIRDDWLRVRRESPIPLGA